ncbi:peptidylprolyl isomerase [Calothrix sp. 336/3]|uniref:peptidylprolyl isomerase n=1 Tax=Calothrix sp. 336/3 TaxID=1337936 RepID=UPI0004E37387|nr:peptidylprolyl isomerase [Calothrix sp. 336/3]AKG23214.1 peptidylprolyl isomerase [Calothrix sp. 336/3]
MTDGAGILIEPEEIINFLKSKFYFRGIHQEIIIQKLIQQTAQAEKIIVTTEEIELEAEKQRREKGLEKVQDTLDWLDRELIHPSDWENSIYHQILAEKLAHILFASEVEKFFVQNRQDFEQVRLYEILLQDAKLAQELYYQLVEKEISFYEAAHIYEIDELRKYQCGYVGKVYRWQLAPELATVVFNALPTHIIEPIKTTAGYHLLMVEEFLNAELTPQRYQEILNHLFQQWLKQELGN